MHGRHDFRFTPAERTQLRRVPRARRHAAGRRDLRERSRSPPHFRRELAAALPGHAIERIPPDDPLFTTAYGGYDIRQVTLRDPEAADDGADRSPPASARSSRSSKASSIDDRWAVIFSPYDISCALEEPRSHRLPRLHPTRRRPHRAERAAVFAESVGR